MMRKAAETAGVWSGLGFGTGSVLDGTYYGNNATLHIKLELIKNLTKAVNTIGELGSAELKEGVFMSPQIRELIKDSNFVLK